MKVHVKMVKRIASIIVKYERGEVWSWWEKLHWEHESCTQMSCVKVMSKLVQFKQCL